MTKRIAIVGGGYIGAELAKELELTADVTLIEPRSHFVHAPAMIRALPQPDVLEPSLIPYDKLLSKGTFVQARAAKVEADGVTLEDGRKVEADYIVVATGSGNATPFKPKTDSIEDFRASHQRVQTMLKDARSIVIVGAGAVGTELAGEIAHFMPEKDITLVCDTDTLFPAFPAKLGRKLEKKLTSAGVTVVKGARAENLQSLTEPYAGTLELSNGQSITADLVFPAIGSRAASEILETLPGAEKSNANRIKTDNYLRPSDLPNVFAAGDVGDCGDAMTIVAATRQKPWLVKTLTALVEGKSLTDLKPFSPWRKAPILVPLGPKVGSSYLVAFTAGNFVTRAMKGKDLFIPRYRKLLNQET